MVGIGLMTRRPNPNTQARKVGVIIKDGRALVVYRGEQDGLYHYAGARTRKYYLTQAERARVLTGYAAAAAKPAKRATKVRRSRKQSAPRRSYTV